MTYKELKKTDEINTSIEQGNLVLGALGYTEHSRIHASKVASTAGKILKELGYDAHQIELAQMAGYLHDMGNRINREDHAHTGALMAFQLLREIKMDPADIAVIITAIGNHDEKTGAAVDPVSAAVILPTRRTCAGTGSATKSKPPSTSTTGSTTRLLPPVWKSTRTRS